MGNKRSRTARPKAPGPESIGPQAESGRPAFWGLDRTLTLLAFGVLLVLVLVLTPVLGRKQSVEFSEKAQQVLVHLAQSDAEGLHAELAEGLQDSYTPTQLRNWLHELKLTELSQVEPVFEQAFKGRGLMRARFVQAGQPGLLSTAFLTAPSLSLSNRWLLANLCRLDQQVQTLLASFTQALASQNWQSAYALTAAGAGVSSQSQSLQSFTQAQQELKLAESQWQWGDVNGSQAMLVVEGHSEQGRLRIELLENPERCQVLIAGWEPLP